MREHNRLAGRIDDLYPSLNNEQIYQLARRIVGAEIQKITYGEYLPAMFGHDFAPDPDDAVYDPTVDASITNSFAHAFFRFGHSQINERTLLVNNQNQRVGSLSIRDAFFDPDILKDNPGRVGLILKGLASQVGQENDLLLTDGIRNNLFGAPGQGGLDLGALDIQRGRDHGLPDFNNLRGNYGLTEVLTFAEISSDPTIQQKLEELYGNVDNIDAFVGALAEDHLPGSSAGPLLTAIISNQFTRLRDGDRFFYTIDELLQSGDVERIIDLDDLKLSDVIRRNTGMSNIQDNVFFDRSALIFEGRDSGSNITVTTNDDRVTITSPRDRVITSRPLSVFRELFLVGSDTSADVFNLRSARRIGRDAYGGGSVGDRLNIFGRQDTGTRSRSRVKRFRQHDQRPRLRHRRRTLGREPNG